MALSSDCESRSRRPSTVSRTPRETQRAASARRYSAKSRISSFTSRAGRCQLSAEKAKSVKVPTPKSGATSTIRWTTSAPSRCPAARGLPCRVAHRPFPSMMMATCNPEGADGDGVLGFIRVELRETGSAVPHGANQCFHVFEVPLQRLPSRGAQPVFSPGEPTFERLGASDVPGLFQLPSVHAQVAVGSLEQPLQLVERQGLVYRQRAHNGQPHPLVNEPVQLERILPENMRDLRVFRIRPGSSWLSHRASGRSRGRIRYEARQSRAPSGHRPSGPE